MAYLADIWFGGFMAWFALWGYRSKWGPRHGPYQELNPLSVPYLRALAGLIAIILALDLIIKIGWNRTFLH